MTPGRNVAYLDGLVRELCRLSHETEWVEFKMNNAQSRDIGEYISALSNGAALNHRSYAYLVWGIEDQSHAVVGTTFSPHTTKVGNEPIENWLLRNLDPRIGFQFHEVWIDDSKIVVLEISPASQRPVSFSGVRYIRVGSIKKRLSDLPERERDLWRYFEQVDFEQRIAAEQISDDEVLLKLDYPSYFKLLGTPLPNGHAGILEALKRDELIMHCDAGGWNVTNLGAILLATNITDFPEIRRKAIRVIEYEGTGRNNALKEQEGTYGYAVGFQGLMSYIMARVPHNEMIENALRKAVPMYPEIAVRELVANALIHQDFVATGAGPTVEMFDDRIEITNPGNPLVETDRFIDRPPRSRNQKLASLMRRFGICEERGSGVEKAVLEVELAQLPAPSFQEYEDSTKVVLFAHKRLADMDDAERIWACYVHACLRYVMNKPMNNASIRQRFGISKANSAQASRLLKRALDSRRIALRDPYAGPRQRAYLPFWALE